MKIFFPVIFFVYLIFSLGGCAAIPKTDAVTQGSLINALLAGLYDGTFTQKDVAAWGDIGIGTFDRLDGEMIVLEGTTYQANTKGEVRALSKYRTPFVTVKHFSPETEFEITVPLTLDGLKSAIDARLVDRNHVYAFRIKGTFKAVTGVNVAGYHFHFLSDTKDFGGHVLALDISQGVVALDRAGEWRIMLPDDEAFRVWNGVGQGAEAIKAVEAKK